MPAPKLRADRAVYVNAAATGLGRSQATTNRTAVVLRDCILFALRPPTGCPPPRGWTCRPRRRTGGPSFAETLPRDMPKT